MEKLCAFTELLENVIDTGTRRPWLVKEYSERAKEVIDADLGFWIAKCNCKGHARNCAGHTDNCYGAAHKIENYVADAMSAEDAELITFLVNSIDEIHTILDEQILATQKVLDIHRMTNDHKCVTCNTAFPCDTREAVLSNNV